MDTNKQITVGILESLEPDDRKRAQAILDSAASLQEDIALIVPDNEARASALLNLDTVVTQVMKAIKNG